jgi:hypothetical protein
MIEYQVRLRLHVKEIKCRERELVKVALLWHSQCHLKTQIQLETYKVASYLMLNPYNES